MIFKSQYLQISVIGLKYESSLTRKTEMVKKQKKKLTPRQREVFEWIKDFIQEYAMPPTVREIGDAFGMKSSSMFDHLKALERKGYLKRGDMGARSLIIMDQEKNIRPSSAKVSVIGRIPAGQPIEAIEHDRGTILVSKDILKGRKAYALLVEGDSMVEAGILDGDYVIVRKQETAENGDIVVALIDDEATLKRFYREGRKVRLEPANREMEAIYVKSGEFRIQGKVIGVQRLIP
jgi:repressor LexA